MRDSRQHAASAELVVDGTAVIADGELQGELVLDSGVRADHSRPDVQSEDRSEQEVDFDAERIEVGTPTLQVEAERHVRAPALARPSEMSLAVIAARTAEGVRFWGETHHPELAGQILAWKKKCQKFFLSTHLP